MTQLVPSISIDSLVALSRRYGADPAYCLAGGGNTSVKTRDRLWVKASGCALGEITAAGFVEMDRTALSSMVDAAYSDDATEREAEFMQRMMSARVYPSRGQRPSVETLIHHLIPRRFVVHTHPTKINAMTCCEKGQALAKQWLGDTVIWQPYVDPGVTLAQSLNSRLTDSFESADPVVVLLENHGLIVAADTSEEIDQTTEQLIGLLDCQSEAMPFDGFGGAAYTQAPQCLAVHEAAAQQAMPDAVVVADGSDEIRTMTGTAGGKKIALAGPLTPDQIVYCRSMPMWLDSPAQAQAEAEAQWRAGLGRYEAAHGTKPWVVLMAGVGLIGVRDQAGLAQTTCDVYRDAARVSRGAAALGGVQSMTSRDVDFIENWEVESYRRSVAAEELS